MILLCVFTLKAKKIIIIECSEMHPLQIIRLEVQPGSVLSVCVFGCCEQSIEIG